MKREPKARNFKIAETRQPRPTHMVCTNKECNRKDEPQPLENFPKRPAEKYGVGTRCSDCERRRRNAAADKRAAERNQYKELYGF